VLITYYFKKQNCIAHNVYSSMTGLIGWKNTVWLLFN